MRRVILDACPDQIRMSCVHKLPRGFCHPRLELPPFSDFILACPLVERCRPLIFGSFQDGLEILGQAVGGVGRFRDHMTGNELAIIEGYRLNGPEVTQRFDPVIAPFTIELSLARSAIQYGSPIAQLRRRRRISHQRAAWRTGFLFRRREARIRHRSDRCSRRNRGEAEHSEFAL